MEKLVERVIGILFKTEETWAKIKEEETSATQLFKEYVAILAACPAIAGFLGSIFKGSNLFNSLLWGILFYLLSLAGVWVSVQIIRFLASNFKITHDELSIFKLIAYSYTAFFVSGIFFIIPRLYWLTILGLYGFYVYSLGLTYLLDCPKQEKFNFTIISVIAIIIILSLVFGLSGSISGIKVSYLKFY